jgi:hypothetical protein
MIPVGNVAGNERSDGAVVDHARGSPLIATGVDVRTVGSVR